MQLTDTLAHHVEAYRSSSNRSSSSGVEAEIMTGPVASPKAGAGAGVATIAAAGDGGGGVIDHSLVGCLANLREPDSGKLFSHQV